MKRVKQMEEQEEVQTKVKTPLSVTPDNAIQRTSVTSEKSFHFFNVPQWVSADCHNALVHCCLGHSGSGVRHEVQNRPWGKDLCRPHSGRPVSVCDMGHSSPPTLLVLDPEVS